MSGQDTGLAFVSLEDRAAATSGPEPLDRVSLRDHVVSAEIGAFQSERGKPQRLAFNVVVEVRPAGGSPTDDVDRVMSYDRITETIGQCLAAERLNLLETLAERIAAMLLAHPAAMRVHVRVEKLDRAPGRLGVELVRSGEPEPGPAAERAPAAPMVLFLDNGAASSPCLSGWLDQLAQAAQPALFCVDLPSTAAPRSDNPVSGRRIALLALEQNAWALAGRDPRLAVVQSRAELNHMARSGGFAVWAPSKMVLDATPGTGPAGEAPLALARWLAGVTGASALIGIGAAGAGLSHWQPADAARLTLPRAVPS